jgi:hypothetical protein
MLPYMPPPLNPQKYHCCKCLQMPSCVSCHIELVIRNEFQTLEPTNRVHYQ